MPLPSTNGCMLPPRSRLDTGASSSGSMTPAQIEQILTAIRQDPNIKPERIDLEVGTAGVLRTTGCEDKLRLWQYKRNGNDLPIHDAPLHGIKG